ncbi:sensor histidine kinase [Methanoregula sp. UBA64]|jgi:signal transduction histidine kinase|uniref:sensor histidine kinase n=1 Tax=Methanoregula sp. UBA64 TaxID=1915554 RepID=UPI0025D7574D|nr:ATP-binding protein [Methanoregula sp. UBA64]
MWIPDTRTLFLILFLINVVLTLVLFTFWKTQKTYDGFETWMLSLLVTVCGYFLYLSGESVPVWIYSSLANLVIALAVMIRLDGTGRYFRSQALPRILYASLLPAGFLLFWFAIMADVVVVRGLIMGLFIVPCFVAAAVIAIRSREPGTRPLRYGFAAALLVMALLWTIIIAVALLTPGDHSLSGPDPQNPLFFIVTILMDIVATVFFLLLNMARTQAELKHSEDALFRANKKLTILSSITRHDIKNQLTALQAYIGLLQEELGTNPVASGFLTKEMAIAEIMGHQIDFTKVYEDMGTTAPSWQNVRESVHRAAGALPVRDVVVEVDRPDVEVYADPLFEKVFYNLIDNALRHGGDSLSRIAVSSRETKEGLVLTCEDDGAGILGADRAHLFEQGFGKHTGLGLFLSQEILSITGITIMENGEPGKGARFELNVPKGAYRFGNP